MEAIKSDWKKELKRLHLADIERKHPEAFELSGSYSMKVKPYNDKTANGLTRCIVDWIRYNGGDAQRINTTGIPRKMKDGRLKWTTSNMRKGTADIHAIIRGRAVSIEVKIGRDRMSEHQIKERDRITRAGGLYFVAHTMEDFLNWYHKNF